MGLKVTLIKGYSGFAQRQKDTVFGLGLKKMGDSRILKDTPAIRGMIHAVRHLVAMEVVKEEAKVRTRLKPRAVRLRDAARAKEEKRA